MKIIIEFNLSIEQEELLKREIKMRGFDLSPFKMKSAISYLVQEAVNKNISTNDLKKMIDGFKNAEILDLINNA